MAAEDDLSELDVSTVISEPGGAPDPIAGVAPAADGGDIRLGRYTTLRLLGKGGMAEVYLAKQDGPAGFQKTCVVKRMRRVLAAEQRFVDMFLREARVAARLNHANIVQIFELGEQDGEYFIAMEYLDGISLHRAARRCWANETSMPMEVVLRAIADAALGLHHAHTLHNDRGELAPLVHRDISPDNLVVTRDGVCKVLDFGIAKSEDDGDLVTRTGELKGKIPYMSPEQIKGEPLDGRSDLWALGVTLYWLLTGKRPFDAGSDHMTIDAIIRRTPESARALNPLIPGEVDRIITSLLDKEVDRRIATGAELHDRLVALLGPSAGTGPASTFANEVLAMPALERSITPGSVLTIVAARPATQWLKRVSENDASLTEVQRLDRLMPGGRDQGERPARESSAALAAASVSANGQEPDTGSTVTGINSAPLLVAPGEERRRVLPIAAGAVAAVALMAGALAVALGDSEAPPLPVAEPAAVASSTERLEGEKGPSAAAGEESAAAGGGEVNKASTEGEAGAAGPGSPGAVNAAQATEPGEAAHETAGRNESDARGADKASKAAAADKASPAEPPPKRTRRASARPRAPKTKALKASAPSTVVWKVKGKQVGRGSGTLKVPPGTSSVTAIDTKTGGTTSVAVKGDAVDYGAVGQGALVLRVRPWARASVGKRVLGTTPLDPVSLPAGKYTVTLRWEGKTKKVPVTLQRGKRFTLKADMRD